MRNDGAPDDYPRGRTIHEDSRFSNLMWTLVLAFGAIMVGIGGFGIAKLWEIDGRTREQAVDIRTILNQQKSNADDIRELRGQIGTMNGRLGEVERRQVETINQRTR